MAAPELAVHVPPCICLTRSSLGISINVRDVTQTRSCDYLSAYKDAAQLNFRYIVLSGSASWKCRKGGACGETAESFPCLGTVCGDCCVRNRETRENWMGFCCSAWENGVGGWIGLISFGNLLFVFGGSLTKTNEGCRRWKLECQRKEPKSSS